MFLYDRGIEYLILHEVIQQVPIDIYEEKAVLLSIKSEIIKINENTWVYNWTKGKFHHNFSSVSSKQHDLTRFLRLFF